MAECDLTTQPTLANVDLRVIVDLKVVVDTDLSTSIGLVESQHFEKKKKERRTHSRSPPPPTHIGDMTSNNFQRPERQQGA